MILDSLEIKNVEISKLETIQTTLKNYVDADNFGLLGTVRKWDFVNREKEIIHTFVCFIKTLWAQLTSQGDWKGKTAVFSYQMFGSGKTFFGTHIISKGKMLSSKIIETLNSLKKEDDHDYKKFNLWFPPILDRIFESKQISWIYRENILASLDKELNKEKDIFIHIDELSGNEFQVRKLWEYLHFKQLTHINEENKILTYFLSGRNTLMNKVNSIFDQRLV